MCDECFNLCTQIIYRKV
ncbi:hypothetical protein I6H07_07805 [Hafnia alvei]|uniref:Uncharacterized protein n=1 Tax=Hafnia alvei TaxID=569 RepID=A0ABD7Q8R9_HAFAL|nr:hypothetical protein ERL64_00240 [Hafnia alvei]NEY30371.1 hypothetical protein [Escherichia coli]RLR08378.1 hypothetical protein EAE69_17335 [Hafnia alvei ATCC 13337]TBL73210.1 hypothetical protein EYY94_16535 [Obesumbacterium proteus]MBI0275739.1 hypothetical protein [Hafnia alvei]